MSLDNIKKSLENKRIAILGFGLEGHSTYRFLRILFPDKKLGLADKDATKLFEFTSKTDDKNLIVYGGENYLQTVTEAGYDVVFKSPGIPLKDIDSIIPAESLESQAGLFLKLFKNRIIGVTGTKGKSTTSSLICEAMKASGFDAMLVGNIGRPVLDLALEDTYDRYYVFEMSSHMLETVKESPRYAVLLNIYEEHLDHYRSFNDYAQAKLNLFRFQGAQDFKFFSRNTLDFCKDELPGKGRPILFDSTVNKSFNGIFVENERIISINDGKTEDICTVSFERKLLGQHNLANIMAALAVLKVLGIEDFSKALEAVKEFNGLEHRLELVGEFSGIRFYNDSISTIPHASVCAVDAVGNVDTLIIGGMDRGIDYSELINFIASDRVPNIICLPTTGHMIHRMLKERHYSGKANIVDVLDMNSAVEESFRVTRKGTSCILSPAAASYGFYKNFEERGRIFKELVRAHSTHATNEANG